MGTTALSNANLICRDIALELPSECPRGASTPLRPPVPLVFLVLLSPHRPFPYSSRPQDTNGKILATRCYRSLAVGLYGSRLCPCVATRCYVFILLPRLDE